MKHGELMQDYQSRHRGIHAGCLSNEGGDFQVRESSTQPRVLYRAYDRVIINFPNRQREAEGKMERRSPESSAQEAASAVLPLEEQTSMDALSPRQRALCWPVCDLLFIS